MLAASAGSLTSKPSSKFRSRAASVRFADVTNIASVGGYDATEDTEPWMHRTFGPVTAWPRKLG